MKPDIEILCRYYDELPIKLSSFLKSYEFLPQEQFKQISSNLFKEFEDSYSVIETLGQDKDIILTLHLDENLNLGALCITTGGFPAQLDPLISEDNESIENLLNLAELYNSILSQEKGAIFIAYYFDLASPLTEIYSLYCNMIDYMKQTYCIENISTMLTPLGLSRSETSTKSQKRLLLC